MKTLTVILGGGIATGLVLVFVAACRRAGALVDQQLADGLAEIDALRDAGRGPLTAGDVIARTNIDPTPEQLDQLWRAVSDDGSER